MLKAEFYCTAQALEATRASCSGMQTGKRLHIKGEEITKNAAFYASEKSTVTVKIFFYLIVSFS